MCNSEIVTKTGFEVALKRNWNINNRYMKFLILGLKIYHKTVAMAQTN